MFDCPSSTEVSAFTFAFPIRHIFHSSQNVTASCECSLSFVFFNAKYWDLRSRDVLSECAMPCHEGQMVKPYLLNPVHLIVLAESQPHFQQLKTLSLLEK